VFARIGGGGKSTAKYTVRVLQRSKLRLGPATKVGGNITGSPMAVEEKEKNYEKSYVREGSIPRRGRGICLDVKHFKR